MSVIACMKFVVQWGGNSLNLVERRLKVSNQSERRRKSKDQKELLAIYSSVNLVRRDSWFLFPDSFFSGSSLQASNQAALREVLFRISNAIAKHEIGYADTQERSASKRPTPKACSLTSLSFLPCLKFLWIVPKGCVHRSSHWIQLSVMWEEREVEDWEKGKGKK